MTRVQICGAALLLAVSARAWADGGIYPPLAVNDDVPTKTRAQVVAELQEAMRHGLVTWGEADAQVRAPVQAQTIRDAFSYVVEAATGRAQWTEQPIAAQPDEAVVVWGDPRVLRAKVRAETLEAARLGLLVNGEGGPPFPTVEQLELIAAAGQRAVDSFASSTASFGPQSGNR